MSSIVQQMCFSYYRKALTNRIGINVLLPNEVHCACTFEHRSDVASPKTERHLARGTVL